MLKIIIGQTKILVAFLRKEPIAVNIVYTLSTNEHENMSLLFLEGYHDCQSLDLLEKIVKDETP